MIFQSMKFVQIQRFSIIIYNNSCSFNNRQQMKKIKTENNENHSIVHTFRNSEITDLSILHRHPNQLLNILKSITSSNTQHKLSTSQKLKLISLAAFFHPVMTKEIQNMIEQLMSKYQQFWMVDSNITVLLQILNVVALVPHINYKILKIKGIPVIKQGSYEEALWINAVKTIYHGQYFQQAQELSKEISIENVQAIRELLNSFIEKKQKARKIAYLDSEEHHYFDGKYHFIDIELADKGLITIDYFPEDYKPEFIQIWLDRTVQLNSLLGNFVCKQKFGEFEYIRGPLMYAMQKGILAVFNNFNQISNQLLVSLKSLAELGKITHNQKSIKINAGFRMLGILSGDKTNKSKAMIGQFISHMKIPPKNIFAEICYIENQSNRLFINQLFERCSITLGYLGSRKLWKRINRLRKNIINVQSLSYSPQEINNKLWNSFFTQQFIDDIQLQVFDLTNTSNPHRSISYIQKYRQIIIGRSSITYTTLPVSKIVKTQYSLAVLEKLIICFELQECPLLVSQTGCGKTTLVQYLTELSGHKLYVYNMSSGTDVSDLIGGFKPIDCRVLLKQLFYGFVDRFRQDVPEAEKNEAYLTNLTNYYINGKYQVLLKSLVQSIPKIIEKIQSTNARMYEWRQMMKKFNNILLNLDKIDSNLVFSFLQGNLIKAIKNGDWILIDQINLATNDVLQKIVPLIEGKSLMLYEKGDLHYIERHPDFRIVACMNPANDSGKKALPPNLADKFTTIIMSEPSKQDIEMMTKELCPQLNSLQISQLYFQIKKFKTISLRNLSRALGYINRNKQAYGWNRSVYDGLMLGFGQKQLLKNYSNESIPKVPVGFVELSGFLMIQGPSSENAIEIFHLTQIFKQHLKDFLRAIAGTELPVLLEGPTSAGKTSMIRYVAEVVGYKCIRINNHQHTEIQEYIGNYFPDKSGRLVFREGPLVQAVRQGYWLILDELNLAKTEILQCLNRLLDDNRELFIPQQQKHIKPHPHFRIFATQNPSSYSGRKTLSRAFRNRFVSISFSDITTDDTMAILQARSGLLRDSKQLSNFVKKSLEQLTNYRQRQRVFEKDGLITIRNLLKWCERPFISKQKFMLEGYAILAEKLRCQQQKHFVQRVLLSGIKYTTQNVRTEYYSVVEDSFAEQKIAQTNIYVQMNHSFKRMAALTIKAVSNREPVLLVGETGCGKTTLAELLAALSGRPFYSINCHKHMEASDLLGSLRPVANPSGNSQFQFVNGVVINAMLQGALLLIDEINTAEDSVLERLNQVLESGQVGIERGEGWETVVAKQGFCIIATMNPSGDYGKKELSPALRNRFTQIWVEPITHPEYIVEAKEDIMKMIEHKLVLSVEIRREVAVKIYDFMVNYNCEVASKYGLTRKLLTMRDIGWVCKFINEGQFGTWQQNYFWSLIILAVEGVKYLMTDSIEGSKLENMKDELLEYIKKQIQVKKEWIEQTTPQNIIALLKNMSFPLLVRSDVPLDVLGIHSDTSIFFSPQTDLSDLLGQYRPHGNEFVWHDEALLQRVKEGGVVALVDLNMAQQQVIQGVNSLFDHRGSLFVVQLNKTFYKAANFKPVVVLRSEGGNGRKGLPNSFLNRFVKISIPFIRAQVKLNYLRKKYVGLAVNEKLISLISQLIQREKEITIEQLQFLIQFQREGLLPVALAILNLSSYLPQWASSNKFAEYQTQILKLLPLRESFNIQTAALIKALLTAYLVYKFSSFSVCLLGEARVRQNLVQSLNYLLKKNLVKILISTMIDINDLMGTYEQISVNESIQEQKSLIAQVVSSEKDAEYLSQKTKFMFVESRVVKSLRDDLNLVYIQVPNDGIAERIQKGLKQVYTQNKKIVMGIQNIKAKKSTITKFIKIDLSGLSNKSESQKLKTSQYFPSNESTLIHCDTLLRKEESKQMIIEQTNEQNDSSSVVAWRRVLDRVYYNSVTTENKNKEQIKDKLMRQTFQRHRVKYIQNLEAQTITQKIQQFTTVSCNKQELINKLTLQCFFTLDVSELSKKLSFLGEEQQYITQVIKKFQVLYICNINNFKQTAKTILPMLFKGNSKDLFKRYCKQIERLYEQLFQFKIKQILIQFSEEEHKLVPILNNNESVRYLMSQDNLNILRVCNEGAHADHILIDVEKTVAENVKLIEIDISSISQWCKEIKIKHIGAFSILESNLAKMQTLFKNPLQQPSVVDFLTEINFFKGITNDSTFLEQGKLLWKLFKPNSDMSINVSYHLKNELNLRYYKEVISTDNLYLQKYIQFSKIKYSGYKPDQLNKIEGKIIQFKKEMGSIQKKLVYRGHDNIENLIQFYKHLILSSQKIQSSNFSLPVIRSIVIEIYQSYYHIYNDILLPYLLALQIIYISELYSSQNNYSSVSEIISNTNESVVALIENAIQVEEGEVDRSKDYVRFQRKFKNTVIVDEYTEEGVAKNKKNMDEEFAELFGKHEFHEKIKIESPFQKIHMLINKSKQNYYPYLSKKILKSSSTFEEMISGIQIQLKYPQSSINIYEQYNPNIVRELVKPVTGVLQQIAQLLKKYPIDNIKNLAIICNKIQERSIYQQIYKILIDCEFLIQKIFQVNPILPMANHITTGPLIQNCLRVRRLQLKNWKQMMELKLRRTQKSDMIEFVSLFKTIREIQNQKQLFVVAETFLRESKMSCINNRIKLLLFLQKEGIIPREVSYQNALFRVVGFYNYLMPEINKARNKSFKQKELEMKEYQKLAGWNSNQYLIFKATCQKFQRKIHHILKRHDEELSITVGTYHQQVLEKQIYQSIKDFRAGLLGLIDGKVTEEATDSEMVDEDQQVTHKEIERIQKEQIYIENDGNIYQKVCTRIFSSLKELQEEHHSTQSKLLIIRAQLSDLQQIFEGMAASTKVEYKYLTLQMFGSQDEYKRGVKYYYGLWDKLCQRSQAKWNKQVLDRMWHVTEKIWVHINMSLKYSKMSYRNELAEDLRIIFGEYIKQQGQNYHPIFKKEIQKAKEFIQAQDSLFLTKNNEELVIPQQTVSLMKLGYILAQITVNLQRNGLCVKQDKQENQQSGSEQIGDGMGIGEGEAHDAAQNVGDQIQFEEQVMGHKDEEKNEDKNAGNKEQNDIEMKGDFQGDMYSKEEQEEGKEDQEGQQQEADEQMGSVDQKQKQKDMKNQAGQAEGSEQADVDVKNQKEGQQQLIDNEREKKEERKGEQQRQQMDEQEKEDSDWDENNQEGDKINKQKEDVEAPDSDESIDMNMDKQPEEVEGSENSGEENEQQNKSEQEPHEKGSAEQKQNQGQDEQNQNEQIGEQIDQQNIDQNEGEDQDANEKEQEPRRRQPQKKYKPAFGRKDINTNNQVLNNEENMANEAADQQGREEQGQGQKDEGSGKPIHNLSSQFLQELLKQQQSQGNEQFIRDLNVLVNDQQEQEAKKGEENAQQFELTQQKDKFATNLPLMDDQKMKNEEQEINKKQKQQNRNQQQLEKNGQQNNKQKQKNQNAEKTQKQKKKQAGDKKTDDKWNTPIQKQTISQLKQEASKKQAVNERQIDLLGEDKEVLVRRAVSNLKAQNRMEIQNQRQNSNNILSEAFQVSKILEQQLKSVLQPLDNAQYKGDFKTGKKLNLKKIIPFIASNFRKDRIWLRRTQPCERNYYIMLALDDTKSMHYGNVGEEALKGLLAISMALQHLSIKTSICSIRDEMSVHKKFGDVLQSQSIVNSFKFQYESSNSHDLSMAAFMNSSLETFKKVDEQDINIEVRKLCFIISDGKMNKKLVLPFIKDAKKQDITYIFIIVDSQQTSILSIKSVEYVEGKMKIKNYMSDFPFQYFLIINDAKELGEVLALTLMQFIQSK